MDNDLTPPKAKRSLEGLIILIAAVLQGGAAAIVLIDYLYEKASELIGSTRVDQVIIWGFGLAAAVAFLLLVFRREQLSDFQENIVEWIATIGAVAFVVYFTLSGSERRYTRIVVEPVGIEQMPFLLLRSYDFEGSLEGWEISKEAAPVDVSIENQSTEAFTGRGFLRLRVNLPGSSPSRVELTEVVYLRNFDPQVIRLVEGATAYVKVFPSEQTEDNQFYAEFQVRSSKGDKSYWSKTRYTISPGKWQPIVWTKPSWLEPEGEKGIYYPDSVNTVQILIWSDKPFVGLIGIDNVSLYIIQRP